MLETTQISNNRKDANCKGRLARCIALPVSRFLRLKRSVSLMVSGGEIVCGTYQSPILLQWRKPTSGERALRATLVRFR